MLDVTMIRNRQDTANHDVYLTHNQWLSAKRSYTSSVINRVNSSNLGFATYDDSEHAAKIALLILDECMPLLEQTLSKVHIFPI
jgi:hypothetical protein